MRQCALKERFHEQSIPTFSDDLQVRPCDACAARSQLFAYWLTRLWVLALLPLSELDSEITVKSHSNLAAL